MKKRCHAGAVIFYCGSEIQIERLFTVPSNHMFVAYDLNTLQIRGQTMDVICWTWSRPSFKTKTSKR